MVLKDCSPFSKSPLSGLKQAPAELHLVRRTRREPKKVTGCCIPTFNTTKVALD